jgi:hypothetical protein
MWKAYLLILKLSVSKYPNGIEARFSHPQQGKMWHVFRRLDVPAFLGDGSAAPDLILCAINFSARDAKRNGFQLQVESPPNTTNTTAPNVALLCRQRISACHLTFP